MHLADLCQNCKRHQMPTVKPGSIATARCCQFCGYVEELPRLAEGEKPPTETVQQ